MLSLSPKEKIAKILRTDKDHFARMEARLTSVTGKTNIIEKIAAENEAALLDRLFTLGVSLKSSAKEVYEALISKIESDDHNLFEVLGRPNTKSVEDCDRVGKTAYRIVAPPKGFFLKLEKAREFLAKEPPQKIMSLLGYTSVSEMLEKEDLFEIYCALRFVEGSEWLNKVFFKQYETLTPSDFEERDIRVMALCEKWRDQSEQFVAKKKHNISHLKELGVVFIVPAMLGISGEIFRMFVLIMHYLYEIPFYSDMFRSISADPASFTKNLTSLLRGDVIDRHFPDSEKSVWLVIQRYLAKEDTNDWRLFVPHINPESMHWFNAERTLATMKGEFAECASELAFWHHLGTVGDYFKDENGLDVLLSFDFVDTDMSLVKQKEMTKYLYHQQESLWNKIFVEYFGHDELDRHARHYLLRGYFEI